MEYPDLNELEKSIGYSFRDRDILIKALTHSSYANDAGTGRTGCNERLEFLGDAVLETAASIYLYRRYPDDMEGTLSRKRAALVCERALAGFARDIKLNRHLRLGKSLSSLAGEGNDAIISDAFEALIGAIYLDGGSMAAEDFINRTVLRDVPDEIRIKDRKTEFQELVQKYTRDRIEYTVTDTRGPDHDRTFVVQLSVGDRVFSSGEGRTKQAAGQEAARLSMKEAEEYFKGTGR
ncbi:MAG: ribonuclease III [Lachnospiraceae bacterium]|nr:ribonuclease III [Lachnospiraceae bacterium]